jgi:hypothetical protein
VSLVTRPYHSDVHQYEYVIQLVQTSFLGNRRRTTNIHAGLMGGDLPPLTGSSVADIKTVLSSDTVSKCSKNMSA